MVSVSSVEFLLSVVAELCLVFVSPSGSLLSCDVSVFLVFSHVLSGAHHMLHSLCSPSLALPVFSVLFPLIVDVFM